MFSSLGRTQRHFETPSSITMMYMHAAFKKDNTEELIYSFFPRRNILKRKILSTTIYGRPRDYFWKKKMC